MRAGIALGMVISLYVFTIFIVMPVVVKIDTQLAECERTHKYCEVIIKGYN